MNIIIPKITKREFMQNLEERKFEDRDAITTIEAYFRKKRGFVFKMPKQGAPVIHLVSGGLDSTVTWELLLSVYKLRVYPLFLFRDRKRSKKEEQSVVFFSKYFREKYPRLFVKPMKFSTLLSPPEIMREMEKKHRYYHPARLLDIVDTPEIIYSPNFPPQRVLPFIHVFYALVYAQYLFDRYDMKVDTVFTSVLAGDGLVVPSQTFTSLRTALLAVCHTTADYGLQYASLLFEKELGHWLYKKDVITIGTKLGLPLEKTWSCYHAGWFQCGDRCQTCRNRRGDFGASGCKDKTIYAQDLPWIVWARKAGIAR